MSQTTPGPTDGDGTGDGETVSEETADETAEDAGEKSTGEAPDGEDETPAVEEDLVSEELRIDGICGVY